MNKNEIVKYLNDNTVGRKTGKKEFSINDIFITSTNLNKNFRLTTLGKDILSSHFDVYRIHLVSHLKSTSAKQILLLDRYMSSPYYFNNRGLLFLFEQTVAGEFAIIDNDFDQWVEMKSFLD
jgi:hypothetical protein